MLFSTLQNIEKCPFTLLVKWEVVSPNSREGQLESISIISSIPLFQKQITPWCYLFLLVLILYLKCGGGLGGGVMFFSHFMLFPKKMCMLEILYSAPSLTATG